MMSELETLHLFILPAANDVVRDDNLRGEGDAVERMQCRSTFYRPLSAAISLCSHIQAQLCIVHCRLRT